MAILDVIRGFFKKYLSTTAQFDAKNVSISESKVEPQSASKQALVEEHMIAPVETKDTSVAEQKNDPQFASKQIITPQMAPIKVVPTSPMESGLPTHLTAESAATIDALLDELLNEPKEQVIAPSVAGESSSVIEASAAVEPTVIETQKKLNADELLKIKLELEKKYNEMQSRNENLKKDIDSGKDITNELAEFKVYCEALREEFYKAEKLIPSVSVRLPTAEEIKFAAFCHENGRAVLGYYEEIEKKFKPQQITKINAEQQKLETILAGREQKALNYFDRYSRLINGILILNKASKMNNFLEYLPTVSAFKGKEVANKIKDATEVLNKNHFEISDTDPVKRASELFGPQYLRIAATQAAGLELNREYDLNKIERTFETSIDDAIYFLNTSSLIQKESFLDKLKERMVLLSSLAKIFDEEMQSNPESKEFLEFTLVQLMKGFLKKKNAAIPPLVSDKGEKINLAQALQENVSTAVLLERYKKLGNQAAIDDIEGTKRDFNEVEDNRYRLYDYAVKIINEMQMLSSTNEQLSIIEAVKNEINAIQHIIDSLSQFNVDLENKRSIYQEIINPFLRRFLLESPELLGGSDEELKGYIRAFNVVVGKGLSDEGLKNVLASMQLELTDKEFNKANIYNKGLAIIAAKGTNGIQEFKEFLSANKLVLSDEEIIKIAEQIKEVQISSLQQELNELGVLARKGLSNKVTSWHADLISIKRGYEISEKITKQALRLNKLWPDYSYLDSVLSARKMAASLEATHSELVRQFQSKFEEIMRLPSDINKIKDKVSEISLSIVAEVEKLKNNVNPQATDYNNLNKLLDDLFEHKQEYDILIKKLEDAKNFVSLSQESFINFSREWELIAELQSKIVGAKLNVTALGNELAEVKEKFTGAIFAVNNYPVIKKERLDNKKIKAPMQFKELLDDVANSIKTTKPQWSLFYQALAIDSAKDMLKNNHDLASEAINIEKSLIEQFANEITAVFYDDFAKITEKEFSDPSGFNNKERCPNIVAADKRFNALIDFVRADILRDTDLNSSIMRFSFWLQVADKCFEKGDFAGMQAIMLAFAKPDIYGLLYAAAADGDEPTVFLNSLPLILQQRFKMLQNLVASGEYQDLRKEFENRLANNSFALLPLNIFKRDIINIKEGSTLALADTSTFQKVLERIERIKNSHKYLHAKTNGVSWLITNLRVPQFYNEKEFSAEQTQKTKEIRKQFVDATKKPAKTLSLMSKEEKLVPSLELVSEKMRKAWLMLKTAASQFKDGNIDNFEIYISTYIQALTPPHIVSSSVDVSVLSKSAKNYFEKYQKLMQEISGAYSKLTEAEKEEVDAMFSDRLSLLQHVSKFTDQIIPAIAVLADAKLKDGLDTNEGSYESVAIGEINACKFDHDSKLTNLFIQAGIFNLKSDDIKFCFERVKRSEQLQKISNPILREIIAKSSAKLSEQDKTNINGILAEVNRNEINFVESFNNKLKAALNSTLFVTPKQFASISGYEKLMSLNQKFIDKKVDFSELDAYLMSKPLLAYDLAKDLAKSVLPPRMMQLVNSVAKAIGKKIGADKILPPVQIIANQFLDTIANIGFFYKNIDTLKAIVMAKKLDNQYLDQIDPGLKAFLLKANVFKLEEDIHKLDKFRIEQLVAKFLDGFMEACEYQIEKIAKLSEQFKMNSKLLTKTAQALHDLNGILSSIQRVKNAFEANFTIPTYKNNLTVLEKRAADLAMLIEAQVDRMSKTARDQKSLDAIQDTNQSFLSKPTEQQDESPSIKLTGPSE